jgi:hypothetical protein
LHVFLCDCQRTLYRLWLDHKPNLVSRAILKLTFKFIQEVCARSGAVFPGAKTRLHWSLGDPSRATGSDEEERLGVFREVRDELLVRIKKELVSAGRESLTS